VKPIRLSDKEKKQIKAALFDTELLKKLEGAIVIEVEDQGIEEMEEQITEIIQKDVNDLIEEIEIRLKQKLDG